MEGQINIVLERFSPIGLDGMGKVRLMNRVDTKYVTTEDSLAEFLRLAVPHFRVVEIDGCRNMPYSTCYYDTSDCSMYYEHERGRAARQKIRMRVYENAGTGFLEIKRKDNRGRTDKRRVGIPAGIVSTRASAGETVLGEVVAFPDSLAFWSDFIAAKSNYSAGDLFPRIRNHFRRITLVDKSMTERLTIDTGLQSLNLVTGRSCSLDGLAIIELKRDGSLHSDTAAMLHALHIHPSGFSKYCIGMAMTDPMLRQNNLKSRILTVRRLLRTCNCATLNF